VHATDQTVHLVDRTVRVPDQTVHPVDRTVRVPDQTVHLLDRTVHAPDQTVHALDRTVRPLERKYSHLFSQIDRTQPLAPPAGVQRRSRDPNLIAALCLAVSPRDDSSRRGPAGRPFCSSARPAVIPSLTSRVHHLHVPLCQCAPRSARFRVRPLDHGPRFYSKARREIIFA
jgi:hypothetical protein